MAQRCAKASRALSSACREHRTALGLASALPPRAKERRERARDGEGLAPTPVGADASLFVACGSAASEKVRIAAVFIT
jgi:hypothetical protein